MKRRILLLTAMAASALTIWIAMPDWLRSNWKPK